MSKQHGKDTVVIIDGIDISPHTNTSAETLGADIHDITTYGKDDHVNTGGLGTSGVSLGGIYDTSTSTGPGAVLRARRGLTVPFIRRTEGTGAGLPQDSFQVVVGQYVETNPVADMVQWACELTGSDAVDSTPQP